MANGNLISVVAAATLAMATSVAPATAGEITVKVSGGKSAAGEIGCALFSSEEGFPLDQVNAISSVWLGVQRGGAECRFENLTPGTYAIAVSQDLNGNRKVDTNFLGIPKEPWGVSNNIRPRLRAPSFAEAAFKVTQHTSVTLHVSLAK